MAMVAESADWATSVDAIVQRTPKPASRRDPLAAQVRLLALLGSGAPLNVLLDGLSTYVETWATGVLCAVMLVDESGKRLLPSAAPSLPSTYTSALGSVPIGIGEGCCGTAAARRAMVVVEDIASSALWTSYAPMALAHGLRACWSVPIFDDAGHLLGTLALYCRVRRAPSAREIDMIQFAAHLAAFVVQRHRDAERLRDNELRLSAAIWGTEIGLWEYSPEGGCRWLNAWPERFDVDPCTGRDALQSWHERMHPEDLKRYERDDEAHLHDGANQYAIDYRISDRDGRWRWVHERGKVIARASDGTPTRLVGACLDIDASKATEAALRQAEDRYQLAINAARLPVWEYDVATDTVRGNVYWHRVVGHDLSETEARERCETWLSDVHPEDAPKHAQVFKEPSADASGFYEAEFRIKLPNGEYKWLLDRGRVTERSADGAPLKVIGVALDIDARKRIENALRESESNLATALWASQAAY